MGIEEEVSRIWQIDLYQLKDKIFQFNSKLNSTMQLHLC
jgi:hypothetical protein